MSDHPLGVALLKYACPICGKENKDALAVAFAITASVFSFIAVFKAICCNKSFLLTNIKLSKQMWILLHK